MTDRKRKYYVYEHYSKDTNKLFYVGVAKSRKRATSMVSRNPYWLNYTNKHGFTYQIVFESYSWQDCLAKEIELIQKYGRKDLGLGPLLNMTDGGEGFMNPSEESRKKISDKLTGIKRDEEFKDQVRQRMLGTTVSDVVKAKMSQTHKNVDKSYLIGRKLPDKTKEKISNSKKGVSIGVGKILTDEHKKAISEGMPKKLDEDQVKEALKLYMEGLSFRKIAEKLGTSHTTVSKYLKDYI
jgi:Helix-turn-helix domain/NUMOD3 motif